jgi:hypothetical protein
MKRLLRRLSDWMLYTKIGKRTGVVVNIVLLPITLPIGVLMDGVPTTWMFLKHFITEDCPRDWRGENGGWGFW